MANCPKCDHESPLTTLSSDSTDEEQQASLRCTSCNGIWVPRSDIAKVRDLEHVEALGASDAARAAGDRRTGVCPEGHGIMTRAKVRWDDPYYLERCSRCGGIWFDAGEWMRIAGDNLLDNLDELWLPSWRRHLAQAESEEQLSAQLESTFGPELHRLLEDVAKALETRKDASLALAYLRERVVHHRRKENG